MTTQEQIEALEKALEKNETAYKELEDRKRVIEVQKNLLNTKLITFNQLLIENLQLRIEVKKMLRDLHIQRIKEKAEEKETAEVEEFGRVKEFWRDLRETAKANGFRWIVDLDDISSLMNISKEKAEEWDGLFRKYHQELGTDRQGGGWVVE